MKAAVIRFPGSNCDQDCYHVLKNEFALDAEYVWHKEPSVEQFDLIVLPGGFSYGDYLRCGAIARYSPVMKSVATEAGRGKLILGICNGFQILCEARLLPGALIRNRSLHFVCEFIQARIENMETAFSHAEVARSDGKLITARTGLLLRMPIAHGEGNYVADPDTLRDLNRNNQIVLRYSDPRGAISDEANPNGSAENIAGIVNRAGNVFGLMPHPERACDPLLGSEDGKLIFQSVIESAMKKSPTSRSGGGVRH
ncbi:MAG: phosphoribosylformylglycinamidine synthase subunit PurQ [Chthoniobacteraceae bacterium]|jgi:phosphoribosylformylglycinamidine synthase